MVDNFYKDLEKARGAEALVAQILKQRNPEFQVIEVGDNRQYFHKGDILVITPTGEQHFFEVKDDSCIWKTGNVLCEDCVYYHNSDCYIDGNMYSDYEIYTVVNQNDRVIYFIDFKKLQKIYRKYGTYKEIAHSQQTTFAYLLDLYDIKRNGALIQEIKY